MVTGVIVYLASGSTKELTLDLPEWPTLKELRSVITPLLNGGSMEHVRVLNPAIPDDSLDLFVDEIGHLKGLPFNEEATRLYRAAHLATYPGDDPHELPWIAGDAVLFMRKVWDGFAGKLTRIQRHANGC
jgi:hypothetical protein